MEPIPFVTPESASLARNIEEKILGLSADTGILFAGVDVTPTTAEQEPIYRVLIGIDRDVKLEGAVAQLATMALSNELLTGADIQIEVRRGLSRG